MYFQFVQECVGGFPIDAIKNADRAAAGEWAN